MRLLATASLSSRRAPPSRPAGEPAARRAFAIRALVDVAQLGDQEPR
ncbi:hypothetical protein [Planotetraspora phitsanulokensis]|nr:hypothetical protein [Planotetraspora phitsanulokensis]